MNCWKKIQIPHVYNMKTQLSLSFHYKKVMPQKGWTQKKSSRLCISIQLRGYFETNMKNWGKRQRIMDWGGRFGGTFPKRKNCVILRQNVEHLVLLDLLLKIALTLYNRHWLVLIHQLMLIMLQNFERLFRLAMVYAIFQGL